MAAALALIAAFCFALAATLQQRGALNLPTISLADPKSLLRLAGNVTWLLGTLVLLTGYLFQAGALDRGRLAVIQPLLVTTIVFALPLGYFLDEAARRPARGDRRLVIIVGLALFVVFGDPPAGTRTRPTASGRSRSASSSRSARSLFVFGRGGDLSMKAAVYGTVAGHHVRPLSALTKPTLEYLHESVGHDALPLGALRARDRRSRRFRPPAGVPRHGPAGAVGRDGVRREPGRRDPDRDPPARRAPQPARRGTSSSP